MSNSSAHRRLLIVDDDPAALVICNAYLTKAGYEVVRANSAAAARNHLTERGPAAFAAVLSDLRMPGEDGLSLIAHIRTLDPDLSTVLMTAEGDKALVTRALREGAQNFIDKPFSRASISDVAAAAVAATDTNRQLRTEATSARSVAATQLLLLGRQAGKLDGRLRLSFRPRESAGGDFAAVYELDENRFVVLVTDVSGHDLRAAFHSAYFQGLARGLLADGRDLTSVFARLNRLLLDEWNGDGQINLSLAACAVCVDRSNQTVQLINCGLPSPRLSNQEGFIDLPVAPGTSPLGWFDDLPPVATLHLTQGQLQFWSDGLEDLAEAQGVSALALAYRLHEGKGAEERIMAAATDDVIAARLDLAAQRDPGMRYPLIAETYVAGDEARIDAIQKYFEESLRLALPTLGESTTVNTLICLREGLINALIHGCAGDPGRHAMIQVSYGPATQSLHVCISDTGTGHDFDFHRHEKQAADELLTEHRGLILMKNLSQNLQVSPGGSRITMEFPLLPNP